MKERDKLHQVAIADNSSDKLTAYKRLRNKINSKLEDKINHYKYINAMEKC